MSVGWADRQGPTEAEVTAGAMPYLDVLRWLHDCLAPTLYLEIGVRHGASLALSRCQAIGVDPVPEITVPLPSAVTVCRQTSDDFFDSPVSASLERRLDLAFIDGMHWFEFALRDFMNIERLAHTATVVVLDDVLPNHPLQAERERQTEVWTGDIWKIPVALRRYREDLLLILLDASPAGLLLVVGLDRHNRRLRENYGTIVREFRGMAASPPGDVLRRVGALDPRDPRLRELIEPFRSSRAAGEPGTAIRQRLAGWRARAGL